MSYKLYLAAPKGEGEFYDVTYEYAMSLVEKAPHRSPHLAFYAIRPGDLAGALEFLSRFGALERLDDLDRDDFDDDAPANLPAEFRGYALVDLDAFWKRRWTFWAARSLWASSDNAYQLRRAWLEFLGNAGEEANSARNYWNDRFELFAATPEFIPLDSWVRSDSIATRARRLREFTNAWINDMLNKETAGIRAFWVRRIEEENGLPAFDLKLERISLWAEMWELFATETRSGILTRACPHCGTLFTPPRKDRYYCSSYIQKLASKNRWRREQRKKKM
jgi:ribosomal protein S27AE